MISPIRVGDTPNIADNLFVFNPYGSINCSFSIFPGGTGGNLLLCLPADDFDSFLFKAVFFLLAIIDDFNFMGFSILPNETNSELVIDTYAVLILSNTFQFF